MLRYHAGDERPAWVATVTVNGIADNLSAGYTFQVLVAPALDSEAVLTKTTNITGATDGVVTVAWAAGELALPVGRYVATLTAHRNADSTDWTVSEPLKIDPLPS